MQGMHSISKAKSMLCRYLIARISWKAWERFSHSQVRLTASPAVSLHDVLSHIKVEGLLPGSRVTLLAEMIDDKHQKVLSHAHYIAQNDGEVDVTRDPSVGGSYKGVFPSGLLSTLKVADENFAYGRILKNDLEVPLQVTGEIADRATLPLSMEAAYEAIKI